MKKQFAFLALGMMLVGGVAHADYNANDPAISPVAKTNIDMSSGGPTCPFLKSSQASLNDSTSPSGDDSSVSASTKGDLIQ